MLLYPIILALFALIILHYYEAYRHFNGSDEGRSKLVIMSCIASVFPVVTLAGFGYVFLQGGSSVAQFSISHDLWSIWYHLWSLLVLAAIPSGLVALVAFFGNLKIKSAPHSFHTRLTVFLTHPICYFIIATTIPDA